MKLKFKEIIFAAGSGILTALSFPKFSLFFFAWISLIPLLFVLLKKNLKQAFFLGFIAGFFYYALLIYWIPSVPTHYGNVPYFLSFLIFILFITILSVFWATFSSLFSFFDSFSSRLSLILAPFIWISMEYILTYFLTGFPWCLLGYSQYKNLYLIQTSSITGVYGISFIIFLFNSMFVLSIREKKKNPFFIVLGLILLVHLYGFYVLKNPIEKSNSFSGGIIQGNVPSEINWQELSSVEILDIFHKHLSLTRKASSQGAQLIVWPEFTVPLCFSCPESIQDYFKQKLIQLTREEDISILIGSIETEKKENKTNFYNSALLISKEGVQSNYAKIHLVPFGEYVPFKKLLFFVEKISHAIGELAPGEKITLHKFKNFKFASPICYEIIFPDLVRKFVNQGANFLVTITNDGWYGRSSAPYQHFSMSVFRAVENRRYLLRAGTTGISGIIDPYGRILSQSKLMTTTYLVNDIYPLNEKSFYTKYGNWLLLICLIIIFFSTIYLILKKLSKK